MDDPNLNYLQHGTTAQIVAGPDPRLWTDAVLELLENPDRARKLGESARVYIRAEHRVSVYVANVIDAYEWMTSGDSLKIRESATTR